MKTRHEILAFSMPTWISFDASSMIFLSSFGIWMISQLILTSFAANIIGTTLLNMLRVIGLLGAGLSAVLAGSRDVPSVLSVGVACIVLVVATRSSAPVLLDTLIFAFAARFMDFRQIAKTALCISAFVMVVVVLGSKSGLIRNYITISGGRTREYLGFLYALTPSQILFNITCLVIYLRGTSIRSRELLLLLVCNIYIFELTNSRLSFFISLCMLGCAIVMKVQSIKKCTNKVLRVLVPSLSVTLFICVLLITVNYNSGNPVEAKLNELLGNRLSLGRSAFLQYGTTLLGQRIDFIGNGLGLDGRLNYTGAYNYVDSLYVRLPILYGWVFSILFVMLTTYVSIIAAKQNKIYLLLILFGIILHCVIDDLSIRLQFNTFLLLAGNKAFCSTMPGAHSLGGAKVSPVSPTP